MRKKTESSKRASTYEHSKSKDSIKIRGGKEVADDLNKNHERVTAENPLKRQIKLHQFPWTEKQKDFFKIALRPDTKIIFVNGPAGTSKTLLSVYCGLQLLNMKVISDIMYLRSAVESSESKLGFLPGSADDKLKFYNLPFLDKLDELLVNTKPEKLEEEKRLGSNSRCFILADPMQTDLRNGNRGGFEKMFKLFSDEESAQQGVYNFEFTEEDIMRSELVKFLVKKLKDLS